MLLAQIAADAPSDPTGTVTLMFSQRFLARTYSCLRPRRFTSHKAGSPACSVTAERCKLTTAEVAARHHHTRGYSLQQDDATSQPTPSNFVNTDSHHTKELVSSQQGVARRDRIHQILSVAVRRPYHTQTHSAVKALLQQFDATEQHKLLWLERGGRFTISSR